MFQKYWEIAFVTDMEQTNWHYGKTIYLVIYIYNQNRKWNWKKKKELIF